MTLLGLTGGPGMGKSTAARFLSDLGLPVVDTDDLAREAVNPGQPALSEIRQAFGDDVFDARDRLRRDVLAKLVFGEEAARRRLEGILHPRIRELWMQRAEAWRAGRHGLGVVVIPLLFETAAESSFDATLCIACGGSTQRERLLARGWSGEDIQGRIAAQLPIDVKVLRADFVIWNEARIDVLRRQIEEVLACIGRFDVSLAGGAGKFESV